MTIEEKIESLEIELAKLKENIKTEYIKIDKTSPLFTSCSCCLYSGDEESVCIQRRCIHAIKHLKECYVDNSD